MDPQEWASLVMDEVYRVCLNAFILGAMFGYVLNGWIHYLLEKLKRAKGDQ